MLGRCWVGVGSTHTHGMHASAGPVCSGTYDNYMEGQVPIQSEAICPASIVQCSAYKHCIPWHSQEVPIPWYRQRQDKVQDIWSINFLDISILGNTFFL